MPMTNIHLSTGTTPEYRRSIAESIHQAAMDALGLPADDHFDFVHEHQPENMIQDPSFFGIERSNERSVFIEIVLNARTVEQKQKLFANIVENLGRSPGVRKEDIFIGVIEVARENWWAYARIVDGGGQDARVASAGPAGNQ